VRTISEIVSAMESKLTMTQEERAALKVAADWLYKLVND